MTVERLRDILNELAENPYWKQDKESQVVITIENFEANWTEDHMKKFAQQAWALIGKKVNLELNLKTN